MILDASAALALILGEPGANAVEAALPGARIGAVNLAELVAVLGMRGWSEAEIREAIQALGTAVEAFDERMAWTAGLLRGRTPHGLGLGDRACLAAALHLGETALTADQAWANVVEPGLTVQVIR